MNKKKLKNLLILFGITVLFTLIVCFIDKKPIGPVNTSVGLATLNGWFKDLIGYKGGFYFISQAFGYMALLVCVGFAGIGVLQLIKKKSLFKVDRNIIALGVLYVVTIALYVLFDKIPLNYRPILETGQTFPEPSFPSSHAMLAIVVYCSAPRVLRRYFKEKGTQVGIYIGFYALAFITVISRALSGVHWLTDIIAGILISVTILYAFFIAIEAIAPKKKKN